MLVQFFEIFYVSRRYAPNHLKHSHKVFVIQKLNSFISETRSDWPEEVILAILILATHEKLNAIEEKNKPFDSPLKRVQWKNVYGNSKYVPEHMKVVVELVNRKGGLENLKLIGLAETIVQ